MGAVPNIIRSIFKRSPKLDDRMGVRWGGFGGGWVAINSYSEREGLAAKELYTFLIWSFYFMFLICNKECVPEKRIGVNWKIKAY